MARKAAKGIEYYPVYCNHTTDKRMRLLISDHDSDGYWVYQNILADGHLNNGYFFDVNDEDEFTLFAVETCKKSVVLVKQIIETAINRGFFDREIYEKYKVLTSAEMQEIYVHATKDRRYKGSTVTIISEFVLYEVEEQKGINIIPMSYDKKELNTEITPLNNDIIPQNNEELEKKPRKRATKTIDEQALKQQLIDYEQVPKTLVELHRYVKEQKPAFLEPYIDLWNCWALKYSKPKAEALTDARRQHIRARLREKLFDFIEILARASKSNFILQSTFFTFDWITDSKNNYVKVLEGNYDNKDLPPATPEAGTGGNTMDDKLEKMIKKKENGQ